MRYALLLPLSLAVPGAALAHSGAGAPWPGDFLLMVFLAATVLVYGAGIRHLWQRAGAGRGIGPWRPVLTAAGLGLVAVLLLSPLDALAERALSIHMIQHFGLMLVAAPLIVLGRPALAALWAGPARWRPRLARVASHPGWSRLTHPIVAWLVYLLALWLWHAPPLHQAALANEAVHALQHASFLGAALIFWAAVLERRPAEGRAAALLAVFATAVQSCALAALLTTTPRVWYPAYSGAVSPWNIAPLADQQLAGLVMWVPCCALLLGSALALLARLLRDVEDRAERLAP